MGARLSESGEVIDGVLQVGEASVGAAGDPRRAPESLSSFFFFFPSLSLIFFFCLRKWFPLTVYKSNHLEKHGVRGLTVPHVVLLSESAGDISAYVLADSLLAECVSVFTHPKLAEWRQHRHQRHRCASHRFGTRHCCWRLSTSYAVSSTAGAGKAREFMC